MKVTKKMYEDIHNLIKGGQSMGFITIKDEIILWFNNITFIDFKEV